MRKPSNMAMIHKLSESAHEEAEKIDMPKLNRSASKSAKRKRMKEEMHKCKVGKLHSGSKKGPMAKNRSQCIAIGLSESGQSRKKSKRKRYRGKR